jgi:hypothetical protein
MKNGIPRSRPTSGLVEPIVPVELILATKFIQSTSVLEEATSPMLKSHARGFVASSTTAIANRSRIRQEFGGASRRLTFSF